ncbi:MAG: hypothetical protein ABI120_12205 [Gemmatimonadaceae bacterium]
MNYFIQIGAGFFALAIVGRVVSAAPPRSLAILEGAYRYDSSAFWQIVPPITAVLFLLASIANWKTRRRSLLLGAFAIFVLSGIATGALVAPLWADMVATGYSDAVNPELQRRASMWYASDWGVRCIDAAAGIALLVALTRPTTDRA